MKIIKRKREHNYSTSMLLGFNCGSINEKETERGIAHVAEHMLFKGTDKYTFEQITFEVEKRGGDFNAYTDFERTCYVLEIPSEHVEFAKELLIHMANNATIPEKELEKEKKVICEEIQAFEDSPHAVSSDFFCEKMYANTPYAKNVIGTKESVRNITRQQILDWIHNYYIPEKAALAIVGNVDVDEKIQWNNGKDSKGHWPSIKIPTPIGRFKKQKEGIQQAFVKVGFPLFTATHPDYYKVKMLTSVLGAGAASILFMEVREKRGLVYNIGASTRCNENIGTSRVSFYCNPEKISEVLDVIYQEIESLQKEGITEEKLSLHKGQLIGSVYRGYDRNDCYSDQLINNYFSGVLERMDVFKDNIMKVTTEDIQDVARRYFIGTGLVTELLPKTSKEG
jgi:predicted Zn-dependent peptidase